MTVDPIKIGRHPTTFEPIENVGYNPDVIARRKSQEKYYRDTLAPSLVASMMSPAATTQFHTPIDNTGARPKLEAPDFRVQKLATLASNINNHLIHEVDENEEPADPKNTVKNSINEMENLLLSLMLDCLKTQKSHTEDESMITYETVKKNQETVKQLTKDLFSQMDEMIARSKTSESLSWVSWVLSGVVIVAGLASIAITWGASVPAVIASLVSIGGGISAVGAGGVRIAQGVLDYKSNLAKGEIKELEFLRTHHDDKIRKGMEEMKHSMDVVADLINQMIEIINNQYQASIMK